MKLKIGEKTVFNQGRFFVGKQQSRCLISIIGLILPLVLFGLTRLQTNANNLSLAQVSSIVIAFLGTIIFFLICMLIDPGITTKDPDGPVEFGLEIRSLEYKGKTHTLSYCGECQIYRPLRCYHCNACGVCIEEMDHHCPWIGNCVGRRSRGYFILFLLAGLGYLIPICHLSFGNLGNSGITETKERFLNIYIIIHSILVSLFLAALLVFQTLLISTGLTTAEFFKNYLRTKLRPFNEGVIRNWIQFFKTNRSHKSLTFEKLKSLQKDRYSMMKDLETTSDLEIPLAISRV